MADEAQSRWMAHLDIVLKVLSGVLVPIAILLVGNVIASQQQREADASLKQQQESDLAQRNADRAANLLQALASENVRERQLAIRIVQYLVKANQFPAELGPALITVSLTDPDPEVARTASEILPEAYKSNPDLEKTVVAETQRILKNGGYYDGEIDGTNSERVKEALRKFQQERGIESDGTLKAGTLQGLRDLRQKSVGATTETSRPPAPTGAERPELRETRRPVIRGRR